MPSPQLWCCTQGMAHRTLILGGTGWLGREIANAFVADGADVTCVARGASGSGPEGVTFVATDRTEPQVYEQLSGDWDNVVELSYEPELVVPALEALADRAAHWTLISSVSVYADNDEPDADEQAPLVVPSDLTEYPDAKVAAEEASDAHLGDRLLVVRPGLIAGPGDPSDRFGYWPATLARGGDALVPAAAGRSVQVIDVSDLAQFVVTASRRRAAGAVNAVGDSVSLADFLALAASVTEFDDEFVTASDDWLTAHDVRFWAGPRSLPLWLPAEDRGFALRSNARYRDLGGLLRPLRETVERVHADERKRGLGRERRAGLTPTEQADLIRALPQ